MNAISQHAAAKMAQAEAEAAVNAAAARVAATAGAAKVEASKIENERKRRVEAARKQLDDLEKRLRDAGAMKATLPDDPGLRSACRAFIADPSRVGVLNSIGYHVPKVQHLTDSLGIAGYMRGGLIEFPAELQSQVEVVEAVVRKSLVATIRALIGEV
jgi:hypothetical protein